MKTDIAGVAARNQSKRSPSRAALQYDRSQVPSRIQPGLLANDHRADAFAKALVRLQSDSTRYALEPRIDHVLATRPSLRQFPTEQYRR